MQELDMHICMPSPYYVYSVTRYSMLGEGHYFHGYQLSEGCTNSASIDKA